MNKIFFDSTMHRKLLEELLRSHCASWKGSIIDIGSKNRRYDSWFKGTITAVDLVPNPELAIGFGDVEKGLPFTDGSFDGALCIEVFQYLDDYMKAASEIHRLLTPKGKAVLTMPLMYADHDDNIRFTRRFIARKMMSVFRSVECHTFGNAYTVAGDMLHRKIILTRSRLARALWYLVAVPYWLFISLPIIKNSKDDCYSGIFLVVTK